MTLPPLSPFLVFLGIAAIGFLFLLITLVFGELFDHLGVDHDVDMGGPGILSGRIISVFVTAFGGLGAISTHYGLSPMPASLVGAASGFLFAGVIYAFARFLYGQQATSQIQSSDLVGQTARVVVAIPAGGVGQIRCRVGEELVDKIARAGDGAAIAEHTAVKIEQVIGELVVVKRQ
jgi:membrane protein implicated in regulation of membrane protease activity